MTYSKPRNAQENFELGSIFQFEKKRNNNFKTPTVANKAEVPGHFNFTLALQTSEHGNTQTRVTQNAVAKTRSINYLI